MWPSSAGAEFFAEVDDWLVLTSENGCAFGTDFEGPGDLTVIFHKKIDGSLFLQFSNPDWSSKEGHHYEISFILDQHSYSGGAAVGLPDGGFLAAVDTDFERDFAAGDSLAVFLEDEFIRKISLKGTSKAIAKLTECVSQQRRIADAKLREERRWEAIPRDPFADVEGQIPQTGSDIDGGRPIPGFENWPNKEP